MIYTKVSIPSDGTPVPQAVHMSEKKREMVFRDNKITFREKPLTDKIAEVPTETTSEKNPQVPFHTPEIVLTDRGAPDDSPQAFVRAKRPHTLFERLLPFSGKLALLAAVSLLSFLLGCTVTDRKLCRVMMAVSAASTGRIPDAPLSDTYESVANAQSVSESGEPSRSGAETYYSKYRVSDPAAPEAASSDALTYLSAHKSPEASPAQPSPSQAVPVQQSENGKIGADETVLYPVRQSDLRASDLFSLANETAYTPDAQALLQNTAPALRDLSLDGKPLVLILHTHGTEGYNECDSDGYYDASLPVRNEDCSKNVVSVGNALAEVLNDFGIATLHDTTLCDKDSFVRAYKTSAALVRTYLEQYPSLRFVIDLHRDAILSSDGTSTAPTFFYADEPTAQLMLVVGTNAAGANHPHWEENLSLALALQKQLSQDYPGLLRRINLRSASFNEQLSNGYLLLECGSSANHRIEAERAAKLFGTGLARMILQASRS